MGNDVRISGAVDRVLRLLLLLRETDAMSVTDAATALDVSPPTAYRLLAALKQHDLAVQGPDRRYQPGPNLMPAHGHAHSLESARRLLLPVLIGLQSALNETVNLWCLEGIYVRNLDGIESTEPLAIRVKAWDRVPAYCSAAGKALLAGMTNQEVERMHANGLPQWRTQRIISMTALKRHLHTIRQQGYATNLEEAVQGINGIGVALRTHPGAPSIGLSCGVPSIRFTPERRKEIIAELIEAAEEMSELLSQPVSSD